MVIWTITKVAMIVVIVYLAKRFLELGPGLLQRHVKQIALACDQFLIQGYPGRGCQGNLGLAVAT